LFFLNYKFFFRFSGSQLPCEKPLPHPNALATQNPAWDALVNNPYLQFRDWSLNLPGAPSNIKLNQSRRGVMAKVLTGFPNKIPDLITEARHLMTTMESFKGSSPELTSALAALPGAIDLVQTTYEEAKSRDSGKVALQAQAKNALKKLLVKIAKLVEIISDGDLEMLRSSGFRLSKANAPKPKNTSPLPAPAFALSHGVLGSTLNINAKHVPGAASYLVFLTDGDPSVAENYKLFGVFAKCTNILVPGLTAGQKYSIIGQCVGLNGMGVMSAPCTLMSL
jgi:hypothetical protein